MTDSAQSLERVVRCYACGKSTTSAALFSEADTPDRLFCFCDGCTRLPMGKQFGILVDARALHLMFEVTREMSETIAADETAFGRVDESDVMAEVLKRLGEK